MQRGITSSLRIEIWWTERFYKKKQMWLVGLLLHLLPEIYRERTVRGIVVPLPLQIASDAKKCKKDAFGTENHLYLHFYLPCGRNIWVLHSSCLLQSKVLCTLVLYIKKWKVDFKLKVLTTGNTEWQWPLSGIHSIMIEKLAQAGEGGGARPPPFHYIYHHVQTCDEPLAHIQKVLIKPFSP